MDKRDFALLLDRFGLSAEGYRKVHKGVQKRIVRHMQQLRCPSMRAYLERLQPGGSAEEEARRLMDVSISRFFRDGKLWQVLEEEVIPFLMGEHPEGLRVWSAGCALGQEVYSFAILWTLLAEKKIATPSLDLWATDVNRDYLARAMEGIYPPGAMAWVSSDARLRFFRPVKGSHCRVVDEIREGIHWQVHDLVADAPTARDFHILFLRNNLLTYYRDAIVKAALPTITDSLAPGGFLVIGRREHLPDFLTGCCPHPAVPFLYRKQGSSGPA